MSDRTWRIGVVALVLATGAAVVPARADVTRVDLRVDGLTCPI